MGKPAALTVKSIVFLAIAASAGCDAIFGDGYEVRLRTDDSEYAANTSTTISLSVENRSDKVVYYLCAGELTLERIENGEVVDYAGLGNCDCLCPNPIEAGEEEDRQYQLNEYILAWINDGVNTDQTTYRFRLVLYEDQEFEVELDEEDQISNEFTLRFQIID